MKCEFCCYCEEWEVSEKENNLEGLPKVYYIKRCMKSFREVVIKEGWEIELNERCPLLLITQDKIDQKIGEVKELMEECRKEEDLFSFIGERR